MNFEGEFKIRFNLSQHFTQFLFLFRNDAENNSEKWVALPAIVIVHLALNISLFCKCIKYRYLHADIPTNRFV